MPIVPLGLDPKEWERYRAWEGWSDDRLSFSVQFGSSGIVERMHISAYHHRTGMVEKLLMHLGYISPFAADSKSDIQAERGLAAGVALLLLLALVIFAIRAFAPATAWSRPEVSWHPDRD